MRPVYLFWLAIISLQVLTSVYLQQHATVQLLARFVKTYLTHFAVFVGFLAYGITCERKYSTQDCYWYVSVLGSCAVLSWDSSIVKCTKIHNVLYILTLGMWLVN